MPTLVVAFFLAVLTFLAPPACAQDAAGQSRSPAPSVYLGAVAGPTEIPQRTTTSPQMMSRTPEWANDLVSQIKVAFANFQTDKPKTLPTGVVNVTASIEFPEGRCTQLLFSGGASGTAPPGGILASDMLTLPSPIPRGAQFWVREYTGATGEEGTPVDWDVGHLDASAGERTALGSSVNDYTASCAPPSEWAEPRYTLPRKPLAILGPTRRPSICLVGDSIMFGATDGVLGAYSHGTHYGYIDRWVGREFGTINLGSVADGLMRNLQPDHYSNRGSLLQYCTHVVVEYGLIDLDHYSSPASLLEEHIGEFIRSRDPGRTMYWYYTTLTPRGNPIGNRIASAASGPGQASKEEQRQRFNSDLRAGRVTAVDGMLDPDAIAERGPFTVNLPGRQSYDSYQGRIVDKADTGYSRDITNDSVHFNAAGTTLFDAVFSAADGSTPGVNNPFALFCRDKKGAYRC